MAKRALVVEDEPNIVASFEFLMRRAGADAACRSLDLALRLPPP